MDTPNNIRVKGIDGDPQTYHFFQNKIPSNGIRTIPLKDFTSAFLALVTTIGATACGTSLWYYIIEPRFGLVRMKVWFDRNHELNYLPVELEKDIDPSTISKDDIFLSA